MSQTYVREEATVAPLPLATFKPGAIFSIVIFAFIIGAAWMSVRLLDPPAAVPATAPAGEFSAERALRHTEVVAAKPHPVGSAAHAAVRDYLVGQLTAAGLQPEVQRSAAVNADTYGPLRAGQVENVVARLAGTASTKSVLLVGHYDSVPTGNGASDNGAAVGAMLETLRALKSGPPLKNDVVFLFSDGEEVGLLGAKAFVEEHPLAKNVGLVLNFEARGRGGPSIMFETTEGNGWLVEQFAKAAPFPVGSSLGYEVYRRLPNDTDMSVFKRAGYPGMNFAYIDGLSHYHTQLDSVAELDQRSLQHHGLSLLSLTRHFGGLDLNDVRRPNSVYFNLLGSTLVNYSGAWVLPLAALNLIVFAGLIIYGLRRKSLTASGLALGVAASLGSLVSAALVSAALWWLISFVLNRGGGAPAGGTYNGPLMFAGFVALTVAVTTALHLVWRRWLNLPNLMAGGLLWWLLLLLAASLLAPGASYVLAWPLLFGLVALGLLVARGGESLPRSYALLLVLTLGALPGVVLLAPTLGQLFAGLSMGMIGTLMLAVGLLLVLLTPHLEAATQWRRWALPSVAALACVGLLGVGIARSGVDARQPRQDHLFYGLNADTGKASWMTFDGAPDEWTSQFLTRQPEYAPVGAFTTTTFKGWFPQAQAPVVEAAAPVAELLGDSSQNGERTVRVRVRSPRQAPHLAVHVDSKAEVVDAQVNGKPTRTALPYAAMSRAHTWSLQYKNAPPEGIELTLVVKADEPLKLRVVDQSEGLPPAPGVASPARPAHLIPASQPFNDSTLVSKSFVY